MKKDMYKHFQYLLEQQKQDHKDVLNDMQDGVPEGYDPHENSELSKYDNHPADMASELYDLEHFTALKNSEEMAIRETNDALEKIKNGTYGICESCGGVISHERLETLPNARNCIRCEKVKEQESQLDEKSKSFHRPVEEDVLEKVMRGDFIHDINQDEPYDGEQALEEVLSFGSSDTPQDGAPLGNRKDTAANGRGLRDANDIEQISNEAYKKQLT